MTKELISRFTGCLLGGAIGDALGAPVEFKSLADIKRVLGEEGVTKFMPAYGAAGSITDDTQMTLFTAEALLRAHYIKVASGKEIYLKANGIGLLRWHQTQIENKPHPAYTGLTAIRGLYSRRAPGATCMSAIAKMLRQTQFANNDSKGCGTVMRMAPVGLYGIIVPGFDSFEHGCDFSRQTHGHQTGYIAGGAFAQLIQWVAEGVSLVDAVLLVMGKLKEHFGSDETHAALNLAIECFLKQERPEVAIPKLGEGWVAEEALAISVYCALMAKDFRHGVLMAVNHNGDTDSTGSMTGNILGAMYGVEALPTEWAENVELADVVTKLATDLATCGGWTKEQADEEYCVNY